MKFKKFLLLFMCCLFIFGISGCVFSPEEDEIVDGIPEQLYLSIGDSYDFSAMDMRVKSVAGDGLLRKGNKISALAAGKSQVSVLNENDTLYRYDVEVFPSAKEMGGKLSLDRGMFQGKRAIVFGDSITDGYMGNETNYTDTYFALLCNYLGISGSADDLLNCNFACGGTTLTYGLRRNFGISGVERVTNTQPFYDTGRKRDPYFNIGNADLCIIFYGTNDFDENVPANSNGKSFLTDTPVRMEDARTIKGGAYYMINKLYEINPHIKILILPPVYRRKAWNSEYVTGNPDDVYNKNNGVKLSDYGEALGEVAAERGAKMINWYNVFNFKNFGITSEYTSDGLHPNRKGHKAMFEYLIESSGTV